MRELIAEVQFDMYVPDVRPTSAGIQEVLAWARANAVYLHEYQEELLYIKEYGEEGAMDPPNPESRDTTLMLYVIFEILLELAEEKKNKEGMEAEAAEAIEVSDDTEVEAQGAEEGEEDDDDGDDEDQVGEKTSFQDYHLVLREGLREALSNILDPRWL